MKYAIGTDIIVLSTVGNQDIWVGCRCRIISYSISKKYPYKICNYDSGLITNVNDNEIKTEKEMTNEDWTKLLAKRMTHNYIDF